jgi:hypothetical protein
MSATLARRRQRARWAVAPHAERLPLGNRTRRPGAVQADYLAHATANHRRGGELPLVSVVPSLDPPAQEAPPGWVTATNPPPWWARRRARALRRAATRAPHRVWPGGPVDQAALSPSTVEHVLGSSSQALTRLVRAHPRGRRFSCPRSDFSRALACGAACAAGPAAAPGTAAPGTAAPGIAPRLIRDNRTVCQP